MSVLYYVRRLYSLDTLDTRFTTSSQTPLQRTVTEHGVDTSKPAVQSDDQRTSRQAEALPGTQPSRWRTPEYYFYYLVFLVAVPFMFKVPYDVSKGGVPANRSQHKHGLLIKLLQLLILSIKNSSFYCPMGGSLVVKWCVWRAICARRF